MCVHSGSSARSCFLVAHVTLQLLRIAEKPDRGAEGASYNSRFGRDQAAVAALWGDVVDLNPEVNTAGMRQWQCHVAGGADPSYGYRGDDPAWPYRIYEAVMTDDKGFVCRW